MSIEAADKQAAGAVPVPGLDRCAETCFVTILVYHGLSEDPDQLSARPLDITPQRCLAEIRFLRSLGFRLVSADQAVALRHRPRPGAHLLVTFDDAHLGTFEVLEHWLATLGIPILLAVCPGLVERRNRPGRRGEDRLADVFWWEEARARFAAAPGRLPFDFDDPASRLLDGHAFESACLRSPLRRRRFMAQLRRQSCLPPTAVRGAPPVHRNMSWKELRRLEGFETCTLAAHGLFHDAADTLSSHALARDARLCRRLMSRHLGAPPEHFVYPHGCHDERTDRVLAQCGFRATYTVIGAPNIWSSTGQGGEDAQATVTRFDRFHGFGYDPAERLDYLDQHRWRHRSLARITPSETPAP